ncbi:GNAT family N-acetyltransferase [Aeromicrobium sp. Root344]|uniref:GNAT family N-acetyltransferase n=1 Tax=Aeromicrobium sp. Root344 TaxID=1736521 RepID=UPI001F416C57|nr:GNAT family N-acetyltransferase [Aeromicrobium sp. Root344]
MPPPPTTSRRSPASGTAAGPTGTPDTCQPDCTRTARQRTSSGLTPSRTPLTTVAVADDQVIGFVTVHEDEIEQVYVDASARGSGTAALLLDHGEQLVGASYERAWLAVVAGNARARRFYERRGWVDAGPFDYSAETDDGTFTVPALRYEKDLRRQTA